MKAVFTFSLILFCWFQSIAQQEIFDRTKYTAPVGWTKDAHEDVISYTTVNNQTGTWCQVAVYKSVESKGNVEKDFASEWGQLVVKSNELTSGPTKSPVQDDNGWKVLAAAGEATFDGKKMSIIHTVISGYNVCVSIICRTNNLETYMASVDKFIESIEVIKPEAGQYPNEIKFADTGIVGTWIKSGSVHAAWADPASVGVAGYTKSEYVFGPGGTYMFVAKTFQSGYQKIILVRESGKYSVAGNKLSIIPEASVIESWSKKDGVDKWGKQLSSNARKLEKTTYTFTSHYFEGIKESNLVLQADQPTERDGPFSGNTTFSNAYYYAPVSDHNPVIQLPESGVGVK